MVGAAITSTLEGQPQESRASFLRYTSIDGFVMSACVWCRSDATRSMWYGDVRLSLWPITFFTAIPYLQRSFDSGSL